MRSDLIGKEENETWQFLANIESLPVCNVCGDNGQKTFPTLVSYQIRMVYQCLISYVVCEGKQWNLAWVFISSSRLQWDFWGYKFWRYSSLCEFDVFVDITQITEQGNGKNVPITGHPLNYLGAGNFNNSICSEHFKAYFLGNTQELNFSVWKLHHLLNT